MEYLLQNTYSMDFWPPQLVPFTMPFSSAGLGSKSLEGIEKPLS
jgi:hypothetical protein